jgi:hypothetical protein
MAEESAENIEPQGPPPLPPLSGMPAGAPGTPPPPPMGPPPMMGGGFPPPAQPPLGAPPGMPAYGAAPNQPPAPPVIPQAPVQAAPPAAPPAPPKAQGDEHQKKIDELEKRLSREREKVLLANLKSQEEKNVAARVETSIKEIQDKLRRDRHDAQGEENRLKLEGKVQELENRLVQERETWVSTLRNQNQNRESQDKEFEQHFMLRVQEMERRWLEEKAQWQKAMNIKEEELRRAKGQMERSVQIEAEHKALTHEKKTAEAHMTRLTQENAELEAKIKGASEREREYFQVKGELSTAREQARLYQERYEREMQAVRMGSKEREQRLLADVERLQHDLASASQKIRGEYESEMRRVRTEADGEVQKSKAQADLAGAALQRMRAVGSALEKQVASLRMQAEENRKLKEELQSINERYKAEFLVLQRRWQDREAELRKQAEKTYDKKLDNERAKIKLRAQEEIQNRIIKVQEQLRREQDGELLKRERVIREETERLVAEKAREARQETEDVRRRFEAELERKSTEGSKRDNTWQERLVKREGEMAAMKFQLEEAKARIAKEEDYKTSTQRERIQLEKTVAQVQEKANVLQGTIDGMKRELSDAQKDAQKIALERESWDRQRKGYEDKLEEFNKHADLLEKKLDEADKQYGGVQDDKVQLQESVAKVEAEHSRQLETWRRKLDLVRRDLDSRVNSLQAELDVVRGENEKMKRWGPAGLISRMAGAVRGGPKPPAPPNV